MTQTGPALQTSSQSRAAPLESGRDPFPAPRDTAARPDVPNSSRTPESHPATSGLLQALIPVFSAPQMGVSGALDTPWRPQSLDTELG